MTPQLLERYPLVSDQVNKKELAVVLGACEQVLQAGIPGDITEFGCYEGTTSLFLQRLLQMYPADPPRELHVYDSFAGLPPKTPPDQSGAGEQFKAGELLASKKQLLAHFKHAGLQPPHIHKGWFSELVAADLPAHIAFAFLDGDFYDSIMDSLKLAWPRLSAGGMLAIDDYQREALPGVKRAVEDFFRGQPGLSIRHQASIALIQKPPQPGKWERS